MATRRQSTDEKAARTLLKVGQIEQNQHIKLALFAEAQVYATLALLAKPEPKDG